MDLASAAVVLIGLVCLAGAVFDWDWFMNLRNARFFVKHLDRARARIVYVFTGLFLVIVGLLSALGVLQP